jgi:hypothetical protein
LIPKYGNVREETALDGMAVRAEYTLGIVQNLASIVDMMITQVSSIHYRLRKQRE